MAFFLFTGGPLSTRPHALDGHVKNGTPTSSANAALAASAAASRSLRSALAVST
jgi:hypothetical protein